MNTFELPSQISSLPPQRLQISEKKPSKSPIQISMLGTRGRLKKTPSIMERRRLDSKSLSLSVSNQNAPIHPKEELRAGVFDLEKSHLL